MKKNWRRAAVEQRKKRRGLGLEKLESRLAFDVQGATLGDDVFSTSENGPQVELDVLANDLFDADYVGGRLITSVSFGSEGGRLEIAPDGSRLRYTPPADFDGVETFDYAVDGAHTATVRVNITSPLGDDTYNVLPTGQSVLLPVLENDPFWTGYGGARRITSVSVGSLGGLIEVADDGKSIRYTAPLDAVKSETFIYVIDDLYSATVTIEIPDPLEPDRYELIQHDPATRLDVLANDPFWTGYTGERRITNVVAGRSEGAVVIAPDGKSLIYTPDTAKTSSGWYDTVTYVVDGLYEERATVIVYRPVVDDTFDVDENSTGFVYNVTENDRFRNAGGSYRDVVDFVTAVTQPDSGGTVAISDDGRGVVYSPAPGFSGVDTFTYLADGKHEATVRVNVTQPVRDDQFGALYQDTPDQALAVLANDFLGNGYAGAKIITSFGATENGGTLRIGSDGKTLFYTPAAGYTGPDRFEYTVDGALTATAELTVHALAVNDSETIRYYTLGQSFVVDLLANDKFQFGYQGAGQVTAVELVTGSADFTYTASGRLSITPHSPWVSIRYTVDGKYEAMLSFSVPRQTTGDAFVFDQNSGEHALSVLTNDFKNYRQSYSGPRKVTAVSASTNGGGVSIDSDGRTVLYTPPADFYGRDTFTYTVDDVWTETVVVNVIRRVRDDKFRVDAADGAQTLPVLVNDLFGANYSGVGQITGVTAAASGASLSIGPDGQSIVYTPAPGFTGVDSFGYTVDGVLKATVQVVVDTGAPGSAETFAGVDDYFDFLLAGALERYGNAFGAAAWNTVYLNSTGVLFAYDSDSLTATRSHSETNVQVAGVDEGDVVEFDSDYSYVLTDSGVAILDAWPADELSVVSNIDVTGRPVAEFLYGDRLTVISEIGNQNPYLLNYPRGVVVSDFADSFSDSFGWPGYPATPSQTVITVIDVSDRHAPQVVQSTTLDGRYVDSRSIDGQVYAIVSNTPTSPFDLRVIDEDDDPQTTNRYETQEEFVARVSANRGASVEAALPSYTTSGADGETVRTGLLNTPDTVHRPLVDGANTLISIVSIDATSDTPGLTDTTAVYSTGAGTIYATRDSLYVLDSESSAEDGQSTRIAKFNWDPASGGVDFATSATVPGTIVNQFAVDETDGLLRIATTVTNTGSGNWSGRDENLLFVLREDDGVMEAVGSVKNWALDEDIRSVRFLGDRAFVTTFRTVDPLFALDLSDPSRPEAVGHVTLPGFSSYMHLVDENHLLTVGMNTPTGHGGPTQVSLFDISDLLQPLRIGEYTFPRFTTSEAQVDHHAFGYFDEHGLLAIPVAGTSIERVDLDGDGYNETREVVHSNELAIFTIDITAAVPADRLQFTAAIEHDATVQRSGYIGDKLYSIGRDAVKVVDVANPGVVIASAELPAAHIPDFDLTNFTSADLVLVAAPTLPTPIDVSTGDRRRQTLSAAREHLAARLGVAEGEPLLVTVERTPTAPGGGDTAVFQVAGVAYLYRIGANGRFEPATPAYAIDPNSEVWNAVRAPSIGPSTATRGDFNGDGLVNDDDAEVWRNAYGDWSLTQPLDADANQDGVVDTADYSIWRDHVPASEPTVVDPDQGREVAPRERAFADLRAPFQPATRHPLAAQTRVSRPRLSTGTVPTRPALLLLSAADQGGRSTPQRDGEDYSLGRQPSNDETEESSGAIGTDPRRILEPTF
ncbi:Beta propeller domain protein [Botrimarina colliarenosi]|uniref:Beta propeller domain protein n=1 Tax=Botrimarina colliarenosi TaxID=2528001 RepID=A0A5C6A9C1_9BACT|nr:beta-propeller domain-containing protein [Botrimarina colliarenosi]TWT96036.1 Beta propeller domain protein [Botrimarina colliarenosi]